MPSRHCDACRPATVMHAVPPSHAEDGWKIASALTARHIGGVVNYMATIESVGAAPSVVGEESVGAPRVCWVSRATSACHQLVICQQSAPLISSLLRLPATRSACQQSPAYASSLLRSPAVFCQSSAFASSLLRSPAVPCVCQQLAPLASSLLHLPASPLHTLFILCGREQSIVPAVHTRCCPHPVRALTVFPRLHCLHHVPALPVLASTPLSTARAGPCVSFFDATVHTRCRPLQVFPRPRCPHQVLSTPGAGPYRFSSTPLSTPGAGLAADDLILTLYFTTIYALAKNILPDGSLLSFKSSQKNAGNTSGGTIGGMTGSTTGSVSSGAGSAVVDGSNSEASAAGGSSTSVGEGQEGIGTRGAAAAPLDFVTAGLLALALSCVLCYAATCAASALRAPGQAISIATALTVVLATAAPAALAPLTSAGQALATILMHVRAGPGLALRQAARGQDAERGRTQPFAAGGQGGRMQRGAGRSPLR
eukprot:365332-Chlamydomonas_euryale.AAC.1